MFYEFNDDLVSVDAADISQNYVTAGYVPISAMEDLANVISIPGRWVIMCTGSNHYSCVEKGDDCVYGVLNTVNPSVRSSDSDRIGFYVSKSLLLIVDIFDEDFSIRDKFLSALHRYDASDIGMQKLCFAVFDSIISGDSDFMQDMEEHIDCLEHCVMQNQEDKDFNRTLMAAKKQLMHMHSYYNSIEDIALALKDKDILGDDKGCFDLLISRSDRLKENVKILSDSVVHLREVYHSSLEIKQNNIMKILTLFTVFFSPLSFVAGWYGMNFASMPELRWRYGYVVVILLCAVVTAALLLFLKRKKWI